MVPQSRRGERAKARAVHTYWVYILASKPYGTLYIGVTNDLLGRVEAHRSGTGSRFTARYGVNTLVHYEPFGEIEAAIQREKTLKHWVRQWKINLIERENPHWVDLYSRLLLLPGNRIDGACGGMCPRDKREDDIG
jgi:putative endonuclease